MKLVLSNVPTITQFKSTNLGTGYTIFKTTVEELVRTTDNTPIVDAQIRALTAALVTLHERKNETTTRCPSRS